MKKILTLCFAISLFFVLSAEAQKKTVRKTFTTSGQFSNISMGSISGDLGGTMVYLTESDGTMFAMVTIAEGDLLPPILVEATVSGKDMRTVEFALPPDENGGVRKFKGKVTAAGLKLDESGNQSMLKRSCGRVGSQTYNNISVGKESGDYGGMEVYVFDSTGIWYALVTIAEGVLLPPQLIEAKVTGKTNNKIEFTLPNNRNGRNFTGTISSKTGTLTLNENGSRSVLKVKCYK